VTTSIRLSAFVLAAGASTACATIMHGSRQDVSIASVPSGASVTINGQERGKTPVAVELPRKDKHLLKIELPGYLPFESYLVRRVSGWVWGNLVFGGIPGLAIDAITGGLYNVKPEEVTATLTAAKAAGSSAAPGPPVGPGTAAPPADNVETHAGGENAEPSAVVLASHRVRIVTEPAGADVFIGPRRVGTTTADGLLIDLPPGEVVCRVEAVGFEAAERRFIIPEAESAGPPRTAVVVIRLRAAGR